MSSYSESPHNQIFEISLYSERITIAQVGYVGIHVTAQLGYVAIWCIFQIVAAGRAGTGPAWCAFALYVLVAMLLCIQNTADL